MIGSAVQLPFGPTHATWSSAAMACHKACLRQCENHWGATRNSGSSASPAGPAGSSVQHQPGLARAGQLLGRGKVGGRTERGGGRAFPQTGKPEEGGRARIWQLCQIQAPATGHVVPTQATPGPLNLHRSEEPLLRFAPGQVHIFCPLT